MSHFGAIFFESAHINDMHIANSVVCGTSKGCIYKQLKPPLVDEHAFPLTGLFTRRLMLQF